MNRIMLKIERIYFVLSMASITWTLSNFSNPASAATDAALLSLDNTNFVVSIAFGAFILILLYLKVPLKVTGLLDNRHQSIKDEIDSATLILEESKSLLADLEREHKVNIIKAENIVKDAEAEAKRILIDSKKEIRISIERKMKLAEDQIKATEALVVKSIKDRAIDKAFLIAGDKLITLPELKKNKSIVEDSLKSLDNGLKKLSY